MCNPYIAFSLLIRAGLDGIRKNLPLPEKADINLFDAPNEITTHYERLPDNLEEAKLNAQKSRFVAENLPGSVLRCYTK